MARPRRACRARAAHQKHWYFIGGRKNTHRAQARAHFSKCAPRAGESSILPTQDGAHDFASKENEHRAEARAPFSTKMCTTRRRDRRGASPVRRPEAPPLTKYIFLFTRDAHEAHRASTGEPWGGPSLVKSTRIARPRREAGTAPARRQMAAPRSLAQQNEFNLHLDTAGHRFGAAAHGGSRRRILGTGRKCGNVARK